MCVYRYMYYKKEKEKKNSEEERCWYCVPNTFYNPINRTYQRTGYDRTECSVRASVFSRLIRTITLRSTSALKTV